WGREGCRWRRECGRRGRRSGAASAAGALGVVIERARRAAGVLVARELVARGGSGGVVGGVALSRGAREREPGRAAPVGFGAFPRSRRGRGDQTRGGGGALWGRSLLPRGHRHPQ